MVWRTAEVSLGDDFDWGAVILTVENDVDVDVEAAVVEVEVICTDIGVVSALVVIALVCKCVVVVCRVVIPSAFEIVVGTIVVVFVSTHLSTPTI